MAIDAEGQAQRESRRSPFRFAHVPKPVMTSARLTEAPQVVILGAGPAGVGAAFRLSREHRAGVVVLEQQETVGGNAGSFELDGIWVAYGSHRLHPACA